MADPILIVETGAGLPNSNSYLSLADAEFQLSQKPDMYKSEWINADDYKKTQVLIWATALLDDWFIYPGVRSSGTQALGFPRSGVVFEGYVLNSYSVYTFLKRATAELANELLKSDLTVEPQRGIESLSVGPISIDFLSKEMDKPRVIPRSVVSIMAPYGCVLRNVGTANVGSLPLERA